MSQKIRILVLAHSPNIGGAELALSSLIRSTKADIDWTVIFADKKEPASELVEGVNRFISVDLPWWCSEKHDKPKKINVNSLLKNIKILEKEALKADILMTNTITLPWLGLLSRNIGKPHIWYIHEFGNLDHNLQFVLGYNKSLEIISKTSERVLTISDSLLNHLSTVIPKKQIDIIHQSIDLVNLSKVKTLKINKNSTVRLLCLGAIKPSKGQKIAFEAVKLLKNQSVSLDIIGPNANEKYVHELISESSDFNNVNIQVRPYNILKELADHHVFLMCSSNEALGRVTIEAMAAGMPVIGFNSPSTKYLLSKNRGLLYDKNSAENLCKTILKLIGNPQLVDVNLAKKFVFNNYSPNKQRSDYLACVAKTLNSKHEQTPSFQKEVFKIYKDKGLTQNIYHLKLANFKIRVIKLIPKNIKLLLKKII